MKLKCTFMALAAASVMPATAAFAAPLETGVSDGVPYSISLQSDLNPALASEPRYPAAAASSNLDGACDVSFVVGADGRVASVNSVVCSSAQFNRAARRVMSGLRFGQLSDATEHMLIRWDIGAEGLGVETASAR